jgi:hypothetical protein
MQMAIEDDDHKAKELYDKLELPEFRKKQAENKIAGTAGNNEKSANEHSEAKHDKNETELSYLAGKTDLYWQLFKQLGFVGLDKTKLVTIDYQKAIGGKK